MSAPAILRNPYVWAFLIGIVTLTAIRPLLRHVPEPPPVLFQLPEFSLVAADGKPFGSADLRGQVYVASFFFTSCRSICPAIMHGMTRLQDGFARNGDSRRPARVDQRGPRARHAGGARPTTRKTLGVDPARWTLLTGDPERVRRARRRRIQDAVEPMPEGGRRADGHRPHREARARRRRGPHSRLLRLERDGPRRGLQPRAARAAAGAKERGVSPCRLRALCGSGNATPGSRRSPSWSTSARPTARRRRTSAATCASSSPTRASSTSAPVRRWLLLNLVILPFRPQRSGEAYEKIWTERGSPLLFHTRDLAAKVQARCGDRVVVDVAMRYGNPSIARGAGPLQERTGSIASSCSRSTRSTARRRPARRSSGWPRWRPRAWNTPFLQVVPPFYDHTVFIDACVAVARPVFDEGPWERVLFSFHGLPERHLQKSDETGAHCLASASCCDRIVEANRNCYRAQCFATARAIADGLGVPEERRIVCFQSRLGRTPWIRPYTDEVVVDLAQARRQAGAHPELGVRGRLPGDDRGARHPRRGQLQGRRRRAAAAGPVRERERPVGRRRRRPGARDLPVAAVVVVGGGITGLAAAHRLVERGTEDVRRPRSVGSGGRSDPHRASRGVSASKAVPTRWSRRSPKASRCAGGSVSATTSAR